MGGGGKGEADGQRRKARNKKGELGGKGRHDSDEDVDDNTSELSIGSYVSMNYEAGIDNSGETDYVEKESVKVERNDFVENLDLALEKRTATREKALKGLVEDLQMYKCSEDMETYKETAFATVIQCLRKAAAKEGILACQVLSLLCIVIGANEDQKLEQISPHLIEVISKNKSEEFRVEAMNTMAMATFVCCSIQETTLEVLSFLEAIACRNKDQCGFEVSDELCVAALEGWSLLATTLPEAEVALRHTSALLPVIQQLLDSGNPDVRQAAGKVVAFLHECKLALNGAGQFEYEDEEYVIMTTVQEKLLELSKESSKKMKKQARKEQKSCFREVCMNIDVYFSSDMYREQADIYREQSSRPFP